MATIMNCLRGLNNDWSYEMELEGIQVVSSRNADEKAVILNRLHEMIEFRAEAQKIETETLQATCPSSQSQPAKIFETLRSVMRLEPNILRFLLILVEYCREKGLVKTPISGILPLWGRFISRRPYLNPARMLGRFIFPEMEITSSN